MPFQLFYTMLSLREDKDEIYITQGDAGDASLEQNTYPTPSTFNVLLIATQICFLIFSEISLKILAKLLPW